MKMTNSHHNADTLVILDFETTGLSPNMGDRTIEIGAVRIQNGEVVDSFQELMDPGFLIDAFIEGYTGITNDMLAEARSCESVMQDFADYLGDDNLVAHNASFDRRFLDAEFEEIDRSYCGEFACSMLLARRLYQEAPNHQLGTLIDYKNIPSSGDFHRALFDAEMTTKLWLEMMMDISNRSQIERPSFELVSKLTRTPKKMISNTLESWVS